MPGPVDVADPRQEREARDKRASRVAVEPTREAPERDEG